MSSISEEIRTWCEFEDGTEYGGFVTKASFNKILALAGRIDAEMVELPISADGKIWTGREECFWIEARGGAWSRHSLLSLDIIDGSRWYVRDTGGIEYEAGAAWFERPDSLEHIARDLEDWAEGNISGSAQSFANRIRELAKEDER